MWRFLSNPRVTPRALAQPLREAVREAVAQQSGDWVLCVHDWSRVNYGNHQAKNNRLQMTHKHDVVGYELQGSLLASAKDGAPLALRLVVSRLYDTQGQIISESLSLVDRILLQTAQAGRPPTGTLGTGKRRRFSSSACSLQLMLVFWSGVLPANRAKRPGKPRISLYACPDAK
jgi:hypothetical protein